MAKATKKKRDYRAEYRRRIERGKARGLTPSQARGHPKAGEKYVRQPRSIDDHSLQIGLKALRSGGSVSATPNPQLFAAVPL